LARVGGEILVDVVKADALNGAADQSWDVGMLFPFAFTFERAQHVVRSAAFAFGSRDEQVVARDGYRARIPLGGDETDGLFIHSTDVISAGVQFWQLLDFEHGNCVERSTGCKKI